MADGPAGIPLDGKFDFFERLEAAISSILAFVGSFLRTMWRLTYLSASVLGKQADYRLYCRPYTYFLVAILLHVTINSKISMNSLSHFYPDDIPGADNATSDLITILDTQLSVAMLVRQALLPAFCVWLIGSLANRLLTLLRLAEQGSTNNVPVLCMATGYSFFLSTLPGLVLFGFDVARAATGQVQDFFWVSMLFSGALYASLYGRVVWFLAIGKGVYLQLRGTRLRKVFVSLPLATLLMLAVVLCFNCASAIEEVVNKERAKLTSSIETVIKVADTGQDQATATAILVNKGNDPIVVEVSDVEMSLITGFDRADHDASFSPSVAVVLPHDAALLPINLELPKEWSNRSKTESHLYVKVEIIAKCGKREEVLNCSGSTQHSLEYELLKMERP